MEENQTQPIFIPEKQPSRWQKFSNRLKMLSPRNKTLLWGFVILAGVAAAAIIYYSSAAVVTRGFDFKYTNTNWTAGNTYNIDVMLKFKDNPVVDAVAVIDATLPGNTTLSDWNATATINSTNSTYIDTFQTPSIQDANNRIVISMRREQADKNTFSVDSDPDQRKRQTHHIATLSFTVPNTAPDNSQLVLSLANVRMVPATAERADDLVVNVSNPNPVQPTDNLLYLSPNSGQFVKNQDFNVDLMLDVGASDIIAVSGQINYDSNLISVSNSNLVVFPTGNITDDGAGTINVLAGVSGDGNENNGNQNLSGVLIATLTLQAAQATSATALNLSNFQLVKDDGQGTLANVSLQSAQYEIVNALPIITQGPMNEIKLQNNSWQAEIEWNTNVNTDSKVEYAVKTAADCLQQNLDQEVSNASQVINHNLTLNNLDLDNTYCYRVVSQDQFGLSVTSNIYEITPAGQISTLNISNLVVTPSYSSAKFDWQTNQAATAEILNCGTPNNSSNLTYAHSVSVAGLNPDSDYTCTARSTNAADDTASQSISFRTLASQTFDANKILKVEHDRECDKWIYCRSAMEVINNDGQAERMCFDVGLCDEKGADGTCVKPIIATTTNQYFDSPDNIHLAKNLSGMAKIGANWESGAKRIDGYYRYSDMQISGADIAVPNGSFESGSYQPWERINSNTLLNLTTDDYDATNSNLKLSVEDPAIDPDGKPWVGIKLPIGNVNSNYEYVFSFAVRTDSPDNKLLRVSMMDESDNQFGDSDTYKRLFNPTISNYWQTLSISNFMTGSEFGPAADLQSSKASLLINIPVHDYSGAESTAVYLNKKDDQDNYEDNAIYLDNFSANSVLNVAADKYVTRDCRLYPNSTAEACNYSDLSGKTYNGWKGYCVEPDPKYANQPDDRQLCLNWWPVDILPGESDIFGSDQQAGYVGRQPLYYCLEAEGNYPYHEKKVASAWEAYDVDYYNSTGYRRGVEYGYFNFSNNFDGSTGFNIYRDDIQEIKIWGVEIDKNNLDYEYDWDDCRLAKFSDIPTNEDLNPAATCGKDNCKSGAGAIIFNEVNKKFWNDDYSHGSIKPNGKGNTGTFNPYAYLRCRGAGEENDANVVSAKLVFDDYDKLKDIEVKFRDGGPKRGSAKFRKITVTLKGDRCNVLAETVSPSGENYAWATRVKDGGWTGSSNILNYTYQQDYAPYGAAVPPSPSDDPTAWEEPLYVMPKDDNIALNLPKHGQPRAGSPYGITDNSTSRWVCQNNNQDCAKFNKFNNTTQGDDRRCDETLGNFCKGGNFDRGIGGTGDFIPPRCMVSGASCTNDADCINKGGKCYIETGRSNGECYSPVNDCKVQTDSDGDQYPDAGSECIDDEFSTFCAQDSDCGGDDFCVKEIGLCYRTSGTCNNQEPSGLDSFCDFTVPAPTGTCQQVFDTPDLSSRFGQTQCIAGRAEKLGTTGCAKNSDCGIDINTGQTGTCVGLSLDPNVTDVNDLAGGWQGAISRLRNLFAKAINVWQWNFGSKQYEKVNKSNYETDDDIKWDETLNGTVPSVTNIRVNSTSTTDVILNGPTAVVTLKFNSNVNEDQLPLVGYIVNWGDGLRPSQVMNLKIRDRSKFEQPHVLYHSYNCQANECRYKPSIQIFDNWGLSGSASFDYDVVISNE